MKTFLFTLYALLFFGLSGCEKAADISVPASYAKESLSFSYPQNWKITEDVKQQRTRYIFVESPGNAILIAMTYSKDDSVSLEEFAKRFSSQNKEELSVGKMEQSTFSPIEKTIHGKEMKGIGESFSMTILGEQVPHIREYYTVNSNSEVAYLVTQTATEDLSKTKPGFELVLSSFIIE